MTQVAARGADSPVGSDRAKSCNPDAPDRVVCGELPSREQNSGIDRPLAACRRRRRRQVCSRPRSLGRAVS
jgi:hypothetical protein